MSSGHKARVQDLSAVNFTHGTIWSTWANVNNNNNKKKKVLEVNLGGHIDVRQTADVYLEVFVSVLVWPWSPETCRPHRRGSVGAGGAAQPGALYKTPPLEMGTDACLNNFQIRRPGVCPPLIPQLSITPQLEGTGCCRWRPLQEIHT